ncbi:MAG: class I SAM-dependent methyltransferase [Alphaproteobacteria bacterium]|nr:class I SAM-dependent methyltransferase [Alphaproteobacteria bacterium]
MLSGLVRIIRAVSRGEVTLGHAYHQILMRLFPSRSQQNDDFDWKRYPKLYREELKGIERIHTLRLRKVDFAYEDGVVSQKNATALPLHPNHQHLYELILGLKPVSVLEVGCGGGDHLRNMQELDGAIKLYGIDRSEGQMQTLRERHPDILASLSVVDLTDSQSTLPTVDLTYSQAVLMHISETNGRFDIALRNILRSTRRHVILIENWTEHDFLLNARQAMNSEPSWLSGNIHFSQLRHNHSVRAMILSKEPVPFPPLERYSDLLLGNELRTH